MYDVLWTLLFGYTFLLASGANVNPTNTSEPAFSWSFEPDTNIIFHAYLIEKNNEIITSPPLRVNVEHGAKLCQVHLLPTETHAVPSFISAHVADANRGFCELRLNESALYQARLRNDKGLEDGVYHLKILAEDCSSPPRLTLPWTVNVVLVPTEHPVWSDRHYSFFIPSTLPAGEVVGKVTAYAAFDFDSGPDFLANRLGDDTGMCAYAIEHPSDSLFDVNGHGVIRSRAVFNSASQHDMRYDLNVTGFDCHVPVSRRSTVLVSVFVRPECAPRWQDLNDELVYPALSTPQRISPMATLKSCNPRELNSSLDPGRYCDLQRAALRIKLLWSTEDDIHMTDDSNPGHFCDLDTLSLRAQRHLCGISPTDTVELLPPSDSTSRTLPSHDYPIPSISVFNGSNAWSVPENVLPKSKHRLDNVPFTLSFWMNRSSGTVLRKFSTDENGRQHIMCITDDHEKNRHHFAVFVRDCKLSVILRREPVDVSDHELYQPYPSHWRFIIDEVCDSSWHHYALVFQPPPMEVVQGLVTNSSSWHIDNVLKLYVDGDLIASRLVQVTDELPMRKIHNQVAPTRVSVGACWHSRHMKYAQHFVGELTGLILTRDIVESEARLQCLVNCKPRLHVIEQLVGRNSEHPDLPALHQSQVDSLAFEAPTFDALAGSLRTVVFFNPRIWHRPAVRPEPMGILLSTGLRYANECAALTVPNKTITIVRLPLSGRAMLLLSDTSGGDHLLVYPSTGFRDIFSVIPWQSLHLTKIGSEPIEISQEVLYQGVWLFPSLEIAWKHSDLSSASSENERALGATVSHCDIALCPSHSNLSQPASLLSHETLVIDSQFVSSDLRSDLTASGLKLDGPAQVENFNKALQHVRWIHANPNNTLSVRCFQADCTAEFETVHNMVVPNGPLKLKSNTLQSVYRIRHSSVHATRGTSSLDHEHTQTSINRPKALRDVSSVSLMESAARSSIWDNKVTYVVAGLLTTLFLLFVFAITLILMRFRQSGDHSQAADSNNHGGRLPLYRLSPKRLSSKPIPHDSSMMQLIANPAAHQEELAEFEGKFCFYDRQVYGGDPDEGAHASDVNEDLSDFDGPATTA